MNTVHSVQCTVQTDGRSAVQASAANKHEHKRKKVPRRTRFGAVRCGAVRCCAVRCGALGAVYDVQCVVAEQPFLLFFSLLPFFPSSLLSSFLLPSSFFLPACLAFLPSFLPSCAHTHCTISWGYVAQTDKQTDRRNPPTLPHNHTTHNQPTPSAFASKPSKGRSKNNQSKPSQAKPS